MKREKQEEHSMDMTTEPPISAPVPMGGFYFLKEMGPGESAKKSN